MKSFPVGLLSAVAVLSLAGNVFQHLRYSSSRPLVTVGGEAISRKQFQDVLESQAGQPVLSKLVFESLVTQAAARQGLTPAPADVQARIDDIQRRAPQVLAPYGSDPARMTQFRHDLGTALALENLRIQDVTVTPAEVKAYYARHASDFALPPQYKTDTVVAENAVDARVAEDGLRAGDPPDVLARQPRLRVVGVGGYDPNLQAALPPATYQQVTRFLQHARVGDIRAFPAGTYTVVFKVTESAPKVVPPLAKIQAQVARAAKLERAPGQDAELAKLYQAAHPSFTSERYAAYFDAFQKAPADADGGRKTASAPR